MSEKDEICRFVRPDDFQFFDNLEGFLRSNGLTFEMRISCIGTDEIKLYYYDLDGELISDLMEFLRKTGESPKIIHFPIQDDIWIKYDSWNQVHKIILDYMKKIISIKLENGTATVEYTKNLNY